MEKSPSAPAASRSPLLVLGALAIFLGDLAVPNEMAYAVSYVVVVLATLWSPQPRVTLLVAALATILTILGAFVDPNPALTRIVVANRAFAVAAIWVTALVILGRKRADISLHSHLERMRAILDTVQAAFVGMRQARGLITAWNPQAQRLFGWSREEAMGRVLAETIIPEELREAHTRGLKHFLVTGEGPVLHKPLEMTGFTPGWLSLSGGAADRSSAQTQGRAFLLCLPPRHHFAKQAGASTPGGTSRDAESCRPLDLLPRRRTQPLGTPSA